jgi:hypothetical protein
MGVSRADRDYARKQFRCTRIMQNVNDKRDIHIGSHFVRSDRYALIYIPCSHIREKKHVYLVLCSGHTAGSLVE